MAEKSELQMKKLRSSQVLSKVRIVKTHRSWQSFFLHSKTLIFYLGLSICVNKTEIGWPQDTRKVRGNCFVTQRSAFQNGRGTSGIFHLSFNTIRQINLRMKDMWPWLPGTDIWQRKTVQTEASLGWEATGRSGALHTGGEKAHRAGGSSRGTRCCHWLQEWGHPQQTTWDTTVCCTYKGQLIFSSSLCHSCSGIHNCPW